MDRAEMVEALRLLVEAESCSTDPDGLERCAGVIDDLCRTVLGTGTTAAGAHQVWRRNGDRPVLLLCHFDTVWPPGTLAAFPFEVDDRVARGPGTFDMKAGIVQCVEALRQVPDGPVTVLFTADEEIGSPKSRPLIEDEARVARAVNAAVELARQVEGIGGLADPTAGTTVTVTMLGGGTAANVVPESAWCTVDVRMWTDEEADRVDAAMAALRPSLDGAGLRVTGGVNRGPLEREASEGLYRRLVALGYDVGAAEVGGASDGNLTAALGVPTLDGLGAVGAGAHARDEHVMIDEMAPRAEMVARLVADLLADG